LKKANFGKTLKDTLEELKEYEAKILGAEEKFIR
jgi:hypothetical protein